MKSKTEEQFSGTNKDQYYQQKNLQNWRKIETYSLFQAVLKQIPQGVYQKSICDLGCGNGFYGRACLENGARTVEGFDLSHDMINEARQLAQNPEKEKYSVVNILDLDVNQLKRTFDIVLVVYLWNYAKNPEELKQFMQIAFSLLHGGGVVFVVTDNKKSIYDYKAYQKYGMYRDPNFISPEHDKDGLEIDYIFGQNKESGHRLTNYRMTKETIEAKAKEVGFSTLQWHKLQLPPDLNDNQDDWNTFLEEPPIEIYSLSKK